MSDWMEILNREINARKGKGGRAAVGKLLGYARTTISLAASGNYPGDPSRIAARVIEVFASSVACPYTQTDIQRDACRAICDGPMPKSSVAKLQHWTCCQSCPVNTGTQTPSENQRKSS